MLTSGTGALTHVYGNLLTSWLYASINEGVYNSTPVSWTQGDWAFVPAELESVSLSQESGSSSSTNTSELLGPSINATFSTPALRARLECNQLDMSNMSAWLTTLDFTNKSAWNDLNIPSDLKVGYELKTGLAMNQSFNGTYTYWDDNTPYFSFFATDYRLKCCGNNDTKDAEAAIGYWSPAADSPHTSVIVKRITGHPFPVQFNDSTSLFYRSPGEGYGAHIHWVWKDIPKVTALNCTPVYETANASVTVDVSTGIVQNYTIIDTPKLDRNALAYNYIEVNVSTGVPYTQQIYTGSGYQVAPGRFVNNVTVSYGYLFHDALLGAANSGLTGENPMAISVLAENLDDRTFNFRLPSLNVDFMSYTSLSLVNNNVSALLIPSILGNISSSVFSMFFKNFVHSNSSSSGEGMYMNGSWALQPRGAVIPDDLGPTMASFGVLPVYLQHSLKASNMSATVDAIITRRVEQLDLSPVAFILCLSILSFLLLATAAILAWHRNYLSLLPRDVDTLGSVLGFVYASEKLLALSGDKEILRARDGETSLVSMGWFVSSGKRRWGVEIVDQDGTKGDSFAIPKKIKGKGYQQVDSDIDLVNLAHGSAHSEW